MQDVQVIQIQPRDAPTGLSLRHREGTTKGHRGTLHFQGRMPIGYKCCIRCLIEYPPTTRYFPKDGRSSDGLNGLCWECYRRTRHTNGYGSRSRLCSKEQQHQYYLNRIRKNRLYSARWDRDHPDALYARTRVRTEVDAGHLFYPCDCDRCGRTGKMSIHHENYSRPLWGETLCYSCHVRHHRRLAQVKELAHAAP